MLSWCHKNNLFYMLEALLLQGYIGHISIYFCYKYTEIKITVFQECNQYVNAHLTIHMTPSMK